MRALSIASTGMLAQQTNVEVIANNLANMNTTGFKQQRAEFQDLLYQNIQTPGAQTSDRAPMPPNGIQLGAGVRTAAVYRITTQGDLNSTGNPYDVAIQGPGYLPHPAGRRHRRLYPRGQFRAVARRASSSPRTGCVVAARHRHPAEHAIASRSTPRARSRPRCAGNTTPQTVGQLELTRFPNEAGLNAIGNNLYLETPASGSPQAGVPGSAGYGTIQQGFLETSNVNSVDEITVADHRAARL